ncbi:hypothetical protein FH972_019814 [Carpinus fangiana]|uniref:Uncharacterized protein n=1 Tax=Carpinus fangiana TaxID=176857 RepID=A0A5N6RRK6_9ROSI|nr:hypothetical protein FH972_019814 [Carpinus fangiana]
MAIYLHFHQIHLQQSGRASAESASTCQKLKGDLQAVFYVLPKDMQQLLLLNPQRAALLQGSSELIKLPGRPFVQVGGTGSSLTSSTADLQGIDAMLNELSSTVVFERPQDEEFVRRW